MLRRLKVEVEKLLPKKVEIQVKCPLSIVQQNWYRALLIKDTDVLSELDKAISKSTNNDTNKEELVTKSKYKQLNNLIMQLRKVSESDRALRKTIHIYEPASEASSKRSDLVTTGVWCCWGWGSLRSQLASLTARKP